MALEPLYILTTALEGQSGPNHSLTSVNILTRIRPLKSSIPLSNRMQYNTLYSAKQQRLTICKNIVYTKVAKKLYIITSRIINLLYFESK